MFNNWKFLRKSEKRQTKISINSEIKIIVNALNYEVKIIDNEINNEIQIAINNCIKN